MHPIKSRDIDIYEDFIKTVMTLSTAMSAHRLMFTLGKKYAKFNIKIHKF